MGFFAAIWNLYLGLLSLLGHSLLVIVGIAMCGYATAQQLQEIHDPQLDVALFIGGILLVSFSLIRRVVWTFSGLAIIWGGLVWFGAQALAEHDHSFAITPELIAIALAPPFLITLVLEFTRREPTGGAELEITLSERPNPDL